VTLFYQLDIFVAFLFGTDFWCKTVAASGLIPKHVSRTNINLRPGGISVLSHWLASWLHCLEDSTVLKRRFSPALTLPVLP